MKSATIYLSGILLLVSVPVFSQTISVTEAPSIVEIDGEEMYRARNVLNRFFRNERHPECYRVLFSREGENWEISFSSKNRGPIVSLENNPQPDGDPAPCGRTKSYVVDRNGNIIREFYPR